jgi:hypothetical protein
MIRVLIFVYLLLAGYSVSWAGRHRMAIKPGGKGEIGFEAVHLGALVAAAAIMFTLPPVTSFQGRPVLAYASFAALLVSLVLNGLRPLRSERLQRQIDQQGAISKGAPGMRSQTIAWAIGHGLAVLYIASISQYMFG